MGMAGYCREIQGDGLVICLETVEISNASIYNIMCWSVFESRDEVIDSYRPEIQPDRTEIDFYTSEIRTCRVDIDTETPEIKARTAEDGVE